VKRNFIRIDNILVVVISFAVLSSSACFCYYSVASADFISHGTKIETFDQEFLFATSASRLKISGPSIYSLISALCIKPIKENPLFPFLTSPFNQRTSILRC
jgi:hypothetical protein